MGLLSTCSEKRTSLADDYNGVANQEGDSQRVVYAPVFYFACAARMYN